jgi:hypothetical protein
MTTEAAVSSTSDLLRRSRLPVLRAGLAIQLVVVAVIAFFIRPSSDALILRYNVFFGVDILGVWWQIYLIPGVCGLFFLGNLALAEILMRRQAYFAALVLVYGALLILVAEIVAVAALISINT